MRKPIHSKGNNQAAASSSVKQASRRSHTANEIADNRPGQLKSQALAQAQPVSGFGRTNPLADKLASAPDALQAKMDQVVQRGNSSSKPDSGAGASSSSTTASASSSSSSSSQKKNHLLGTNEFVSIGKGSGDRISVVGLSTCGVGIVIGSEGVFVHHIPSSVAKLFLDKMSEADVGSIEQVIYLYNGSGAEESVTRSQFAEEQKLVVAEHSSADCKLIPEMGLVLVDDKGGYTTH